MKPEWKHNADDIRIVEYREGATVINSLRWQGAGYIDAKGNPMGQSFKKATQAVEKGWDAPETGKPLQGRLAL